MLHVEGLTKHYGSIPGVENVSFRLLKGSTLGLLGPNGAGKSTIIRMLAGTLKPTRGRVFMTASLSGPESIEYKKQIGYLPETAPLYAPMRVSSYLRFVAQLKMVPVSKLKDNLERVLFQCRLEEVAEQVIGRLSKGFRQRVGLAQALINDPQLLILDEPTAGLDPRQTNQFRKLICSMKGERTVLLSTHILPEVRSICSSVIIINRGEIAAQGELDGLLAPESSQKRYCLVIRGPRQAVSHALEGLPGVRSVTVGDQAGDNQFSYLVTAGNEDDPREHLALLVSERGWQLLELRPDHQELENMFLEAITGSIEDESLHLPL